MKEGTRVNRNVNTYQLEILNSREKECNIAICSNTDGIGGHYAKVK